MGCASSKVKPNTYIPQKTIPNMPQITITPQTNYSQAIPTAPLANNYTQDMSQYPQQTYYQQSYTAYTYPSQQIYQQPA